MVAVRHPMLEWTRYPARVAGPPRPNAEFRLDRAARVIYDRGGVFIS